MRPSPALVTFALLAALAACSKSDPQKAPSPAAQGDRPAPAPAPLKKAPNGLVPSKAGFRKASLELTPSGRMIVRLLKDDRSSADPIAANTELLATVQLGKDIQQFKLTPKPLDGEKDLCSQFVGFDEIVRKPGEKVVTVRFLTEPATRTEFFVPADWRFF